MKARLLKKILNNTGYTVNNNEDYIAVGSPMCHDLISVSKSTFKITYALDTWRNGRASLEKDGKEELLFIWDKLQELIDNGGIQDIMNGQDTIEKPLPVFTAERGKLISTFTDHYGWPNTTINGDLMYDNTYFDNKEAAIQYGIKEVQAYIKMVNERIVEKEKELQEVRDKLTLLTSELNGLQDLYYST